MKKWWSIGIAIIIIMIGLGIYFYPYKRVPSPTPTPAHLSCAKEGEQFSSVLKDGYPKNCCEGLAKWFSGFDTHISIADKCYETGLYAASQLGVCINCGNNVCEDIENPCNCQQDCAGKEKSDYATIEEFCNNDFTSYCEDSTEEQETKLCNLCK